MATCSRITVAPFSSTLPQPRGRGQALDRYVELEVAGVGADAAVSGMKAHLRGCPACREEHDELLEFVRLHQGV
jgi:hypothetical protein